MIKTALKHYLYEFCINQMFDGFKRNLIMNNNINQIKVGGRYNCIFIKCYTLHEEFYNYMKIFNCVVIEEYYEIVTVKFTQYIHYGKNMEVLWSNVANKKMMVDKNTIIEIS